METKCWELLVGAAGSGYCSWKPAGQKAPSWAPKSSAELWTSGQEQGFMNKSRCVPAVPADKAMNAVPASGACSRLCEIQWGCCHKCHGIMCEGLSPQHVLCLQQLHGDAWGQLSCADSVRETHFGSSFLNVQSWRHFLMWELGSLPACCCLVAVKALSSTVKCHQLADGHGSNKCLQYVLLTEPTPMCSPELFAASILEKEQGQAGCWSSTAFKPQWTK